MNEVTSLPENISGAKHLSRTVSAYPLSKIVDEFDLTNYVKRSLSGLQDLAKSLEEYGLLEPITLHYDSDNDKWEMIDGRRRTGASYILGVDYVPVKIFYNLPLAVKERLVVSLNALKEEISAPDLAAWTNELEGYIRNYNVLHLDSPIPLTNKAIGQILSRSPDTVSNYRTFNALPDLIKEFIKTHPKQRLFSKGVAISKKIIEPDAQIEFFDFLKKQLAKDEENKKALSDIKSKKEDFHISVDDVAQLQPMSRTKFNSYLINFAEEKNNPDRYTDESGNSIVYMKQLKETKSTSNDSTRFIKKINEIKKYISNFKKLLDISSDFTQDFSDNKFSGLSKNDFIKQLYDMYSSALSDAPEKLQNAVYTFLTKEDESDTKTYLDYIKSKRKGSKQNGDLVLRAIGDEEVQVPINRIRLADSQVRTTYDSESLENLAEEMALIGQVKPGLLKPVYDDPNYDYEVIYGHRRFKAANMAKLKTYSAYIRDDLDAVDIGLLQSIEDLSEKDSPLERAKKLYSHYELIKSQKEIQGEDYSQEDFIKTHRSLQSPKTMREAFALLSLPHELQYCVDKKLLSKANALLASKLSPDDQFSVLYNSLVGQQSPQKIKKSIKTKISNQELAKKGISQMSMFDDSKNSYSTSLAQFENHLLGLFNAFVSYASKYSVNNSSKRSRIKSPLDNGLGKAVYMTMATLIKEIKPLNGGLSVDLSAKYSRIEYKR
ncbi:ParB/RepB/Spo0J family partition protein [Candidatus Woesearchaeota archaeon]|nr:ParB/RepB/Spo0J family partition protein [Candidatus Woesearchaeota archaeon]